jgi:hypothetical protein
MRIAFSLPVLAIMWQQLSYDGSYPIVVTSEETWEPRLSLQGRHALPTVSASHVCTYPPLPLTIGVRHRTFCHDVPRSSSRLGHANRIVLKHAARPHMEHLTGVSHVHHGS